MWDGSPRKPNALTNDWLRASKIIGRRISLHALRHTHASSLIAAGVDILTISRRLGHASPSITLSVYGPLYANTDDLAAQAVEKMFARIRTERGSGRSKNKHALSWWQSGGNFNFQLAITHANALFLHDGDVAEGGGLLTRYTLQRRIEGSIPPVSASTIFAPVRHHLDNSLMIMGFSELSRCLHSSPFDTIRERLVERFAGRKSGGRIGRRKWHEHSSA